MSKLKKPNMTQLSKTPPEDLDFSEGIVWNFAIRHPRDYFSQGALMTKEEWLDGVETSFFVDWDGWGDPCRFDYDKGEWVFVGGSISPSRAEHFPEDATHILWYNR